MQALSHFAEYGLRLGQLPGVHLPAEGVQKSGSLLLAVFDGETVPCVGANAVFRNAGSAFARLPHARQRHRVPPFGRFLEAFHGPFLVAWNARAVVIEPAERVERGRIPRIRGLGIERRGP
ncbi:hypothetical protein SDC9_166812 [bioreactor metagenome]|uniref:Uncharacterized protein n=1 Tax=bioreactor metagenome TaxID=1076179 RepID=A0A645G693_9ZZZZ